MRYIRLLTLFWKYGFLTEAEYRSNFAIHVIETMIKFLTGISVLWVVFSRTSTIGEWNWNELIVVLGLWFIMAGLLNMVIAPSIKQFMNDVWKGNLDYVLTKPQDHQFMASTRKVEVFQIVDILVGVVILLVGLQHMSHVVGIGRAFMFALTLFSGGVIIYSFWIVLGALSIWVVKLENIVLIFYAMFEAGRWPTTLYPFWLRYSLVFLVPITLAITVPAEAIVGRINWTIVLFSCGWAVVVFLLSRAFFRYGVRRRYMGASA